MDVSIETPPAAVPGRDPTPVATRLILSATLVGTVSAFAWFLAARGDVVGARFSASFLVFFSGLFLLRVLGQLAVVAWQPGWLPPASMWNLTPYPLLLPAQLGILGLMAWIDESIRTGGGAPATPRDALGIGVLAFAAVYAAAMAVRYVVRMRRRPEQRWFGGTIPIVFHEVLAAYLAVFGIFHVSH